MGDAAEGVFVSGGLGAARVTSRCLLSPCGGGKPPNHVPYLRSSWRVLAVQKKESFLPPRAGVDLGTGL
ncbi:hypothetical protein DCS_00351 [Drechmeria coniospora]|uniref:Uncharacterized protein n=1 Tax=Drechmeria coniospora TaxID=98403 RepID=A0A151GQ85_DRECN|nr:hypothetical protein DCS_00351 [Drechmeria coniospora]KYK59221.1 hypothetical protein DCS_00351 [Drechmeria coniospora]ODA77969.1 hypothetical protein RJ55_06572 [Drechmeria coniospora]